MMSMLPWLTSFAVLLSLAHSSPSSRCVRDSVKGDAKEAIAVFSGKAVAPEYVERVGGGETIAYRFEVERVWKGEVAEEVLLYTQQVRYPNGVILWLDMEDFMPQEGERYLVFAYRGEGGRLTTRACSRSTKLQDAEEAISELGIGRKPEKKDEK